MRCDDGVLRHLVANVKVCKLDVFGVVHVKSSGRAVGDLVRDVGTAIIVIEVPRPAALRPIHRHFSRPDRVDGRSGGDEVVDALILPQSPHARRMAEGVRVDGVLDALCPKHDRVGLVARHDLSVLADRGRDRLKYVKGLITPQIEVSVSSAVRTDTIDGEWSVPQG
jgi:hypothetical protein